MCGWLPRLLRRRADAAGAPPNGDIALTIVQDGRRRDITVRELAVGTKLAGDALLQVLVEKGLVTHEEVGEKIRQIGETHYRPGTPPTDSRAAPPARR